LLKSVCRSGALAVRPLLREFAATRFCLLGTLGCLPTASAGERPRWQAHFAEQRRRIRHVQRFTVADSYQRFPFTVSALPPGGDHFRLLFFLDEMKGVREESSAIRGPVLGLSTSGGRDSSG
jgi:hypothetical protein